VTLALTFDQTTSMTSAMQRGRAGRHRPETRASGRPRNRGAAGAERTEGNLADRLFESVKRQIVEYRLEPETILSEATLASEHGVSRAPAREALKRLCEIGFARAVPRVGYIVTSLSVRDFDEIFALRLALEPMATELAVPRATDEDLDRLERLARSVYELPKLPLAEQGAAISQLNASFHREVARIAGNSRLERTIAGLIDDLERVMHMLAYSETAASVLDEHSELVAVMRAAEPQPAGELMREQLEHDYEVMRALVTRSDHRAVIRRG
jgi:DNA-binding GntR family transcriptional regulator